ncbi:hypothetical protein DPMN_117982 [Dreissena polymorpha]|uniref:EGF-like domain-containing protein n=1 Tax=Dreissena polymorpha TaxID=45954 RepID=A0A9D4GFM6_DREPO|nr:hypothetical protein DPMN_117982 [Dreissena polymorpha]
MEFEKDFNLYPFMGEVCSPECAFGGIKSSSSACLCDKGFWDASCSSVCPGGATKPCSGFGSCDQKTGKCNCPINRMGSDDCSICSNGWYGADCEITDNAQTSGATTFMTMMGQLGSAYTLDGLTYQVKTQGELLLLAISNNVIIQGKFMTCYTNFSCMSFLAARIGDNANGFATITVQSQRSYNSKPYVYINGDYTSLDTTSYFKGFTVKRSDYFEVTLTVNDMVTFIVRTVGQYLYFRAEVDQSFIPNTSGLLSGNLYTLTSDKIDHLYNAQYTVFGVCSSSASDQTVLASESSTVLALNPYTQEFQNSTTMDISRFKVQDCDRIIHYPSADYESQSVGGYALSFNEASFFQDFYIDTNRYTDLTFELLVRTPTANDSGVLFAFTSDNAFSIISGNSSIELHTYINNTDIVYDTEIALNQNEWNKVLFTFETTTREASLYVIYANGAVSSTDTTLFSDIFSKSGTLSIGHWRSPPHAVQYNLQSSFTGDMENFLVWNVIIDRSQVSQLHQMNPALASSTLIYALQFNEGDGGKTYDSITSAEVKLPSYPWKSPEWIVSDLSYISGDLAFLAFSFFTEAKLKAEAENLCGNGMFTDKCTGMNNATLESYYVTCMQAIAVTKQLTSGYNVVLDAYKVCSTQNSLEASNVSAYCDSISDDNRNATACASSCLFGMSYSNGTCLCFTGYYGDKCDSACPGTSDSPCSNHGTCLSDGTCKCAWNWNGDAACSSCSSDASGDMIGPDCTILSTSSLSSTSSKVGAVSSNGYFMTFNGQQISLTGQTGAFMLFSSANLGVDIHLYQVSCNYGSCVAAVSLESATSSVVITPAGQGYAPVVFKNGVEIKLDDTTVKIDSNIDVIQNSLTDISVRITTLGSVTVQVLVQEQFLQASVYTAPTVCQSATGIFGACDSTSKDYSSMSENEITEYIVKNFRLSSSVILTALKAPVGDGQNITGYALQFNKNSVMTRPLVYPKNFTLNGANFSLSMYWKPSSYGGYIISYGKDVAFTVLNTSPLKIQYEQKIVATSITPTLNEWNQLILTFKRGSNGTIDLYFFDANSDVTHEIVKLDCPRIFDEGGTVMLGEYMPAKEFKYTYNVEHFIGVIDEVSIWKNPIPDSIIYQANLLSTKVSGFSSELSLLVSFTEGVGTVAFDEIDGNNMILPKAPWSSPKWLVSDLGLKYLRKLENTRYTTNQIDGTVETTCAAFFDDLALSASCSRVSPFIRWWYKQNCMVTATLSGNVTDVTMAMVDFASVCKVTGGSESSLYDIICKMNLTLPGWLVQKCSGCAFGYKEDDKCVCYYGYYGDKCQSVCAGGAANPCNGHGICTQAGTCQCTGRFDGAKCDACLTGWTGDKCTIMKQAGFNPLGNNAETLVAQVNLLGQLSMFDGVVVDMPLKGYYELMSLDALGISLHGRFGVCESSNALHSCLIGFVVEHNGTEYYISHDGYDQVSSVQIMTAGEPLMLYGELQLGNITLELESKTTIKMKVEGSDMVIKLSSISERLMATVSLPRAEFDAYQPTLDGIVTSCDTAVAVTASNCSSVTRQAICDKTHSVASECELPQTKDSLAAYVSKKMYTNQAFMDIVEKKYLSPLAPNCLEYSNGNGMTAAGITLPSSDFALEMHVKPKTNGGVLMTYDKEGEYLVLLNHDVTNQLVLHTATKNFFTGLKLAQNKWNQISLAWRDDAGVMELYLADDNGKIF